MTVMSDDDLRTQQTALVWHLVYMGALKDPAVRAAMLAVPRHLFVPHVPATEAYRDKVIPTKQAGETWLSSASQPAIVALQLDQLGVQPGMRVLEIGAGWGYNAALLRALVGPDGQVTTVDIDDDLTAAASAHLAVVGMSDVTVITGDGALGYPPHAPYDRIILTVNAGDIAPAWIAQLTVGGVLVLPLSIGPSQFSIAFAKGDDGALRSRSIVSCGFMPLRGSMDNSEPRAPSEDGFAPLWRAAGAPTEGDYTLIALPRAVTTAPPSHAAIVDLPQWRLYLIPQGAP